MPSVYIKTYGCQMNERDSEAVAAQLLAKGYVLAKSEANADVVLLNTCSVRDFAEQKAINKMSNVIGAARNERRNPIVGFMGCMAQSRGRELIDQLPDVDLVLGTQKFHRAGEYLDALLAGKRDKIVDIDVEKDSEATIREHLVNGSAKTSVSAFVSIMQGCNQHCTFCIVPYTRGEERSRTIPDIITECRELVARGVREITLLGQIVTSYGKRDIPLKDGRSAFVQLLDAVHEIEGLERIRFTSPHPKGYGDDLAEAYGRLPKLCESAHIPLQVCREVAFDNAYIFKYSSRRDTPAADMPDQVPQTVREERNQRLLNLVNEIASRKYDEFIGRQVQILVEGPSKKNAARYTGRTRCNRIVLFEGSERHRGQLMDLKIERTGAFTLYGNPAIVNL